MVNSRSSDAGCGDPREEQLALMAVAGERRRVLELGASFVCTVVTYDAAKQRVKLSDGWGYTKTFPIREVWLAAPRNAGPSGARTRVYATLIGAGAGLGALVGSIITALLMR